MLLPPSTIAAAGIDQINQETASFVRAQLARSYDLLWTTGNPQDVLDALGNQAAAAVQHYSSLWSALSAIGEAGTLPEPIASIYTINTDGTVTYNPPPAPEEPAPVDPPVEP